MADFEYRGHTYRLATLDAMTQFHVSRRLMPVMAAMGDGEDRLATLFSAIGSLSDADSEYVIGKCLSNCLRVTDGGAVKIYNAGRLMFEDIGMAGMIMLTFETLKDNLADFFTGLGSGSILPAG